MAQIVMTETERARRGYRGAGRGMRLGLEVTNRTGRGEGKERKQIGSLKEKCESDGDTERQTERKGAEAAECRSKRVRRHRFTKPATPGGEQSREQSLQKDEQDESDGQTPHSGFSTHPPLVKWLNVDLRRGVWIVVPPFCRGTGSRRRPGL